MNSPTIQKTAAQVRRELVDAVRLDLIGPTNDHPFATELLPESPSRWYLTGFLVPTNAPLPQRFDETSSEEIDSPAEPGGLDDDADPDQQAASTPSRRSFLPSSLGLSVLMPGATTMLKAVVFWGDYTWEGPDEAAGDEKPPDEEAPGPEEGQTHLRGYRRTPHTEMVEITLPEPGEKPRHVPVPHSGGLVLVATVRLAAAPNLPPGTRVVSVFLVNSRTPDAEHPYRAFAFQCCLELHCHPGFVPRPDPRSWQSQDEWDQRVGDLQYRDVAEYAVGHGVSPEAVLVDGRCDTVRSTWTPLAEVERVNPAPIPDVELRMEALGALTDGHEAAQRLTPLVAHYREWIHDQEDVLASLSESRHNTAQGMLIDAGHVAERMEAGIALLNDPEVLEAFRIANRVMARSFRQREAQRFEHKDPTQVEAPTWRPFQLAYLLMTLRGIVEPAHHEREVVDLLFFPTGGGKTEAYLALSAFTLVLRRLRSRGPDGKPTVRSAGISVLMRYTLRLLTLDQLSRAAGMICALELEREQHPDLLGDWPFEIGLWVGQAATPNVMGRRNDNSPQAPYSAYTKTMQFKKNDKKPSPIPLEECPWCGTKFTRDSFHLVGPVEAPTDLRVHCVNHTCAFSGDRPLPILGVDEPIYRRLPCFLIATVDKFAALPWVGRTGTLFGKVERYDARGFYGPCDTGRGVAIPGGHLPGPDLIIQDELHLISGPLGTIAGLYETAVDALSARQVDGQTIRPKVIASTATVRRADSQIRALFDRSQVVVFPPPGPDRRDSFFAETISSLESPARLYMGIAAQGRSLKVVLLRAALALLSAGQRLWVEAGGTAAHPNPADAYMTLLGYFNALRELGGSRRIVEDEVRTRLLEYQRRRRRDPEDHLFVARNIFRDVLELTSRVTTNDVATAKRRLALPFSNNERVDVALATNMISVGLDIIRLGLMVVLGQPKTSSEYIQATSRVGRDPDRPGLVVTLLNIHKPRDRSHYERFTAYHESFYRNVEATSVTPFSPRALDRALPAVLVALCRQYYPSFTPPAGAGTILAQRAQLDEVATRIAARAREHRADMPNPERDSLFAGVLHRCGDLLDDWFNVAERAQHDGSAIQYQKEANSPNQRLLRDFLDPELPTLHPLQRRFRANRSMRDVEAPVEIEVKTLNDWGLQHD